MTFSMIFMKDASQGGIREGEKKSKNFYTVLGIYICGVLVLSVLQAEKCQPLNHSDSDQFAEVDYNFLHLQIFSVLYGRVY